MPIRYANGSIVDFVDLEDPAYGYATYDWDPCRKPFSFVWMGNQRSGPTFNRSFDDQKGGELYSSCNGNTVSVAWDPLNRPPALTNNQSVSLRLINVQDLAGNPQPRPINLTFSTGILQPNSTRRLLFADEMSELPGPLRAATAIGQEAWAAETGSVQADASARRRLLQDVNTVLGQCLGPDGGERPAVEALVAAHDASMRALVVQLQATSNAAGDDSLAVASRLVAALKDKGSCLRQQLREGSAVVRAVFTSRHVNEQMRNGLSEAALKAARREASQHAAALGLRSLAIGDRPLDRVGGVFKGVLWTSGWAPSTLLLTTPNAGLLSAARSSAPTRPQ
ncbi:hypothetical protein HYH03_015453 [Edaphochlamys debaryana]|uniref:Uncharacterized protein n=1 Tax=Edaphochlamys debaryana TaxID=47281 RepID=A0A835XRZ2_9CHLO|nr:hypothetical protein HYH03_015453 [Edaphochlamys debaryana]|eukprot:KAG2485870.1 hypothetical protein HYH03_015453 [Edaphochlamys debaryana]